MKAHLIDMHLLVPRSRSSEIISQKMAMSRPLVFHKHILFFRLDACLHKMYTIFCVHNFVIGGAGTEDYHVSMEMCSAMFWNFEGRNVTKKLLYQKVYSQY